MQTSSWHHVDDLRETWLFLLLGMETDPQMTDSTVSISYWEIGVGNAETLIRSDAQRRDSEDIATDADLFESLLDELDQYRYEDTILIIPSDSTLQLLRRGLSQQISGTSSLRGFSSISVADQLERYFGQDLADYDFTRTNRPAPRLTDTGPEQVASSGAVQSFWELWQQIFTLIPAAELTGDPL